MEDLERNKNVEGVSSAGVCVFPERKSPERVFLKRVFPE